ncbi:MAG: hypothetical protein AB7P07_12045 [Hyphomonadaceae bacterium]
MLACLALAFTALTLTDIPGLAQEVEADARALTAQTEMTPAFLAGLEDFSADAMQLSDALRSAGVTQDLPCIFRGISEDAHARAAEFQAASDSGARDHAFAELRALLDDAILLAPMAAEAANAEIAETR